MAERRVAITGLGAVTAAGVGAEALWQVLLDGTSRVRTLRRFDPAGFGCRVGGELEEFSARGFVPRSYRKAVKVMARDIEIAVAAADLAFRDSGVPTRGTDADSPDPDGSRIGCDIGAGLICTDLEELGEAAQSAVRDGRFDLGAWGAGGMADLTPLWLLKYLPNMLSCHVTIIHDVRGPSNTITCGDASGHLSVCEAARWIERGAADVAVAGGAESKINPMGLLRQHLLGRVCTTCNDSPAAACRPFDAAHAGTVVGEGGGLLILEDMDRAVGRGARIYAELAGFGAACDPAGFDVTRPTSGSLHLAVRHALADAGIEPGDVGIVVAHGTGVPGEDAREAEAWAAALGPDAHPPAFALTGAVGSLFAGAGGVELAAAALAMHHQTVPPTANFESPADAAAPALSPEPRRVDADYAVAGSFSVGGQSAACVLKRYTP